MTWAETRSAVVRADVLDARRALGLVALAPQLRAAGVEEVARRRSRGSSPTSPRVRPSRKRASSSWRSSWSAALDEGDDLVLALARQPGDQVDERVGVGGDEVHRRGRSSARSLSVGAHRRPPAPRHARVADLACRRACARASTCPSSAIACMRVLERARPTRRPGAPSRRPRRRAPPRTPRAVGPSSGGQPAAQHAPAELVPLDLVGDERRDEVVEVGLRGEQDGERPRRRCRTSAAGGRAPRRRPTPRAARCPRARKTAASWPMTTIVVAHDRRRAGAGWRRGRRRGRARRCRPAGAARTPSRGATARARAGASRRWSAAASCRCGGRARPRRRGSAMRRSAGWRGRRDA